MSARAESPPVDRLQSWMAINFPREQAVEQQREHEAAAALMSLGDVSNSSRTPAKRTASVKAEPPANEPVKSQPKRKVECELASGPAKIRNKIGAREPKTRREAAIKAIGRWLAEQSLEDLLFYKSQAEFDINFLRAEHFTTAQQKVFLGRWCEIDIQRPQLHFLLGRALVMDFDRLSNPERTPRYGTAMYQLLYPGKDVNVVGQLANMMRDSEVCNLPKDERKFVDYDEKYVRRLLQQVREWEEKEDATEMAPAAGKAAFGNVIFFDADVMPASKAKYLTPPK